MVYRVNKAKHIATRYQMLLTIYHEHLKNSGHSLRFHFEPELRSIPSELLWRDTSYEEYLAGERNSYGKKFSLLKNRLESTYYYVLEHPFWNAISSSVTTNDLQSSVYEKLPEDIQYAVYQIKIKSTQGNSQFDDFYPHLKTIEKSTTLEALAALISLIRQHKDYVKATLLLPCLSDFSYKLFNRLLVLTGLHHIAPELFSYLRVYIFDDLPRLNNYSSPWLEENNNWVDDYISLLRTFLHLYQANTLTNEADQNSTCYWLTHLELKFLTFQLDHDMALRSDGKFSGAFEYVNFHRKAYSIQ